MILSGYYELSIVQCGQLKLISLEHFVMVVIIEWQQFRDRIMNSYQSQLELYRQQFYALTLRINLLEVELAHKNQQMSALLEQLEQITYQQHSRQKNYATLQNDCNSLREHNKWLEDQMEEVKSKHEQRRGSELHQHNLLIAAKDEEIQQLKDANANLAKQNNHIKAVAEEKRRALEEMESRAKLDAISEIFNTKSREQELEELLDLQIKKIEVKPEAKLSRAFNCRLLPFPNSSTIDLGSKNSSSHV